MGAQTARLALTTAVVSRLSSRLRATIGRSEPRNRAIDRMNRLLAPNGLTPFSGPSMRVETATASEPAATRRTWSAIDVPRACHDDGGVNEELDPREAERARRRDREADAARRALMRPGMGKVFKQILDAQAKAASEPPKRKRRKPA
jgi:hypothetical protein